MQLAGWALIVWSSFSSGQLKQRDDRYIQRERETTDTYRGRERETIKTNEYAYNITGTKDRIRTIMFVSCTF